MDSAKCTEDGRTYAAVDFQWLPNGELARKRRSLECPKCGGPAFFRKASRSGQAACFGSRSHEPSCELATPERYSNADGRGEDQDEILNPGNWIVVDLGSGESREPVVREDAGLPRNKERHGRHVGGGVRSHAPMRRSLSTLLRHLIETPNFKHSSQTLEITGYIEMKVRDLFVPLLSVTAEYEGHFRGYWGMLSDARQTSDGTLWLNSWGPETISFCLNKDYVNQLFQQYGIEDEEGLAGAYILVFGSPSVSQRKKVYCDLTTHPYMTMRLS